MPAPQIQNALPIWGMNTLAGYTGDDRFALTTTMLAVTACARGDVVALSTTTSGGVISALTGTGAQLCVGIAAAASAAGGDVPVVVYGPFYGAKKDGTAISAGDAVGRSGTVAGGLVTVAGATAVTTVATSGLVLGIAMGAATAGATTVDVFVCKF